MGSQGNPLGGRLVYSTRTGRIGDDPDAKPTPKAKKGKAKRPPLPSTGVARVRLEKKGRGGKEVTVLWDLPERGAELKALGKVLRKACGTGGTVTKEQTIELQGDHLEAVTAHFAALGRSLLRSGG